MRFFIEAVTRLRRCDQLWYRFRVVNIWQKPWLLFKWMTDYELGSVTVSHMRKIPLRTIIIIPIANLVAKLYHWWCFLLDLHRNHSLLIALNVKAFALVSQDYLEIRGEALHECLINNRHLIINLQFLSGLLVNSISMLYYKAIALNKAERLLQISNHTLLFLIPVVRAYDIN